MAMHFGSPEQQKYYYGKDGESAVNQENFWKRATKREWKINGAKEQGYADVIDQKKIDQMRSFLHHRGASRGSSRVHAFGEQGSQPARPSSRESRVSRQTGLTNVTRGTGWDSRASLGTEGSQLLKELLASNLALKQEFGSLKNEMMRTTNRLAQMEPGDKTKRLGTGRTKTPMLPL